MMRVPMIHPARVEARREVRIYMVRKSRVPALLAAGWGIFMGRLGGGFSSDAVPALVHLRRRSP